MSTKITIVKVYLPSYPIWKLLLGYFFLITDDWYQFKKYNAASMGRVTITEFTIKTTIYTNATHALLIEIRFLFNVDTINRTLKVCF